jgi:hypothetical protein
MNHMYTNGATSSDIRIIKKYPNVAWGRSVKKSTFQSTARQHDHVVRNDPRHCFYKCSPRGHPSGTHKHLPNLWSGEYHTSQDHGLRRRPFHVELDMDAIGNDTPHEPDQHPKQWRTRPDFTIWPPQRHAEVVWIISHLASDTPTAFPLRLHGLSAEITMETTTDDGKGLPHSKVPRDTRVKASRSTRLVFRAAI